MPLIVNSAVVKWVHNNNDQETVIEYENTSDKEIAVAAFELTYTDKLDRVLDTVETEAVTIHQSGHRTLMPGKKNKGYFDPVMLHPASEVHARAMIVKFADGTKWEAERTEAVNLAQLTSTRIFCFFIQST